LKTVYSIQILCFWILSIILLYLKHNVSLSMFRWNLLSWAQSKKEVPISGYLYQVKVKVKVKVMLRQTVSQSVCRGVKFTVEPVTRYYILSESCCVVSVGRPLWREVESVSCQSLSTVFSPLSKIQYNLHCTCYMF
jgi:hypothetical protein